MYKKISSEVKTGQKHKTYIKFENIVQMHITRFRSIKNRSEVQKQT